MQTPQQSTSFGVEPVPNLPTPSGSTRPSHGSLSASFSLGPKNLVDSLSFDTDANTSATESPMKSRRLRALALDPNRSFLHTSPRQSPSPRKRAAKARERAGTGSRHPLANDTFVTEANEDDMAVDENEEEAEEEENGEWTMIDRMRLWRHDALMQHLYDTAAFWGDKILTWTNDPNDAFWLAQTYFLTAQYSRAETLLVRPFPTEPTYPPQPSQPQADVNGHSFAPPFFSSTAPAANAKGKQPMTAASAFGLPAQNKRVPSGPTAVVEMNAPANRGGEISRLVDMSVACRYLAAQTQMRQGKWSDATEMLGEANPFRGSGRSGPAISSVDGGIKVEASMCHLRGLLMVKLNRSEQAKHCFMEALALDVKCFDAFEQLVNGQMMTPDEEWEFVQHLAYKQQTPEDAEFIRLIYTSRLQKYKHTEEHALARRRLAEEYGLADNPDVLFTFADALYSRFRWADCFVITSRILELVSVHRPTMPLHIACMHHLSHQRSRLFLLAHDLVEKEPDSPFSWYAVGVWYLTSKKWGEARTFFSKTSLMDPRFAPAWIAFAHTFALEGEHDHAVTAYSTCARLFTGSHLPFLFVGMEHITLSNWDLADETLNAAHKMCDGDPLLMNERGVMAFNRQDYDRAVNLFKSALDLAQVTQTSQEVWSPTYLNLGTALRKLGRLDEAKSAYERVLEIDPRSSQALAFLGVVYHLMDNVDAAIVKYHEALSIDPINGYVLDLLNIALDASIAVHGPFGQKVTPVEDDETWAKKMQEHRERRQKAAQSGLPLAGSSTT